MGLILKLKSRFESITAIPAISRMLSALFLTLITCSDISWLLKKLVKGLALFIKHQSKSEDIREKAAKRPQILFITSNRYKYETFREALGAPVQFIEFEIEEIQGPREKIVRDKLSKVSHFATETTFVFVDDTSIHMSGLYGFPGQYGKDFIKMVGLRNILKIADKVGKECRCATIYGLAYVKNGELITKLFYGDVLGDIDLRKQEDPREFQDIFFVRDSEYDGFSFEEGVKIGRYRAAEKAKEYFINIGLYDFF